jgi:hypothetical protein
MNAAVWFGAAVFWLLGAGAGATSGDMLVLLGSKNFPYYSIEIAQIIATRYFYAHFVCAAIALLHLAAEWLYFGNAPRRSWLALLAGLVLIGVIESNWLAPRFHRLNVASHAANRGPAEREQASRSFRTWQATAKVLNLFLIAGLGVYLWRVANPPDPMRFVSATKFRS